MNRRQRKKQKVDHVQVLKDRWQAIDFSSLKKINKPDVSQWTSKVKTFWTRLPRLHRRLLSVLVPLLVVLLVIPTKKNEPAQANQAHQRVAVSVNTESLSEQPSSVQPEQLVETNWREYTVKKGDTLAQVFRKTNCPWPT